MANSKDKKLVIALEKSAKSAIKVSTTAVLRWKLLADGTSHLYVPFDLQKSASDMNNDYKIISEIESQ